MAGRIHSPSTGTSDMALGRTLPSLLDDACERCPHPQAFLERGPSGWEALSNLDFRCQAEELALGLTSLGLQPGDRVCLYAHSDLSFCLADMACLMAGLIDVPIYLTHPPTAVRHILCETEARALIVSDLNLLEKIKPLLAEAPQLAAIVIARPGGALEANLTSFGALRQRAREFHADPAAAATQLKADRHAQDLATIIYTSGTTGLPKGVMLSHQNLSSNALAAFSEMGARAPGPQDAALSFLPLTHVFARMLLYGFIMNATPIYFSDPDQLSAHLRDVRPTTFATVPRVLEKAFERILAAGEALKGPKKRLFDWALARSRAYDLRRPPIGLAALQHQLADRLVFSKWRAALGGRVRFVIVGGAALRPELVNVFGAAGIEILQGYGLTETSPVISYNRLGRNHPGTVGELLPGVEVTISEGGEILTRGPHVMQGYYRNPEATAEVIDAQGWFHTGDLGKMSEDGYLSVTGRIKNLFKLSTGKYVMPQPLEAALEADTLIEHALMVGEGEKFAT
ncbi:MAG TPA: long-chain fatty acid--CoA ligase, partial [Trueperaceae bacterium]